MPSSGKSTLGRLLAHKLGYNFVDTDELIVQNENKTVADIFADKGEDYFRTLEKTTLRNLGITANTIVATGGGMPCFNNNIAHMLQLGKVVYLDVTPDELLKRLNNSTSKNERPLLAIEDQKTLYQKLFITYQHRQQFYRQAHIIVSKDFSAKHVMELIQD